MLRTTDMRFYVCFHRCLIIVGLLLLNSAVNAQVLQFPQGEFPLTNYEINAVPISEIMTGGPPRDGIPAIDNPKFISADEASNWLADQEPVIVLTVAEETRAYPLQILMYHEIVNDEIGQSPVAVTFCPLCNASIVFDSVLGSGDNKDVLTFGTTGRLRNSDLIMYDRQTESWWQQFTGTGIIGDYTGVELTILPSQIASFADFKETFPGSLVLSQDTGFQRPYGNNPYRGYDAIDSNPFLFRGELDPRLPPMERVLSIRTDRATQLLPVTALSSRPVSNHRFDDKPVVVIAARSAASALDKGVIAESRLVPVAAAFRAVHAEKELSFVWKNASVVDQETGTTWNSFGRGIEGPLKDVQLEPIDSGVHFAFAWLAFDPDANIIKFDR